jgi:hypothetical protein
MITIAMQFSDNPGYFGAALSTHKTLEDAAKGLAEESAILMRDNPTLTSALTFELRAVRLAGVYGRHSLIPRHLAIEDVTESLRASKVQAMD